MTEERKKLVSFAGPYFVTTQEVMVSSRLRDKIRTIEDLRDPVYRVCTSGGSTTEAELEKHQVKTFVVKDVGDCVAGIRASRYDAVSSDESILAGFLASYPRISRSSTCRSARANCWASACRSVTRRYGTWSRSSCRRAMSRAGTGRRALADRVQPDPGPVAEGRERQPQPLEVPKLVDFDDKAPAK
ncbi:transporter substrate-binding domain-containing protein [Micromonospora sp. M12]